MTASHFHRGKSLPFPIVVTAVASALFSVVLAALLATLFLDLWQNNLCSQDVTGLTRFDQKEAASVVASMGEGASLTFAEDYCDRVVLRMIALFAVTVAAGFLGAAYMSRQHVIGGPRQARTIRFDVTVLFFLMLVGLIIRLSIIEVGLWRDESSSFFNSILPEAGPFWERFTYSELNPPAFYLLLHEWMGVFGTSDVAIKIPSLIFGVLLIPATYFLGRAIGSPTAGLIAAALGTFSHEAIYYSQEARPYTLAAVFATLTTIFAIRSFDKTRKLTDLLAFVAAGTVLAYSHYAGLVFLGVLFLGTMFFVWRKAIDRAFWLHLGAYVAIFVLYLPWLPVFFQHLQTGTPWTIETSLSDLPRLFGNNLSYAVLWDAQPAYRVLLDILILVALAASAFRYIRWERNKREEPEAIVLLLGSCFLFGVIIFTVMAYSGRYLFPFLSLLQVFLSIWIIRLVAMLPTSRSFAPASLALLAGMLWIGVNAWHYATQDSWAKSGVRALIADIATEDTDKTIFVISPDFVSPTFGYYSRDLNLDFVGFGRNDDPHIFSPVGYSELWNDQKAIERLIDIIDGKHNAGSNRLILVRSQCGTPLDNEGQVPYSRADEAAKFIRDAYPEEGRRQYPGFLECILATQHCLGNCPSSLIIGEGPQALGK